MYSRPNIESNSLPVVASASEPVVASASTSVVQPSRNHRNVVPTVKMYVMLESSSVPLSPHIQKALETNEYVFGYVSFINTWYLYTKTWQTAVSPTSLVGGEIRDGIRVDVEVDTTKLFYPQQNPNLSKDYWVVRVNKGSVQFESIDGPTFQTLCDRDNYWRCREIITRSF